MNELEEVIRILEPYLSPPNARALLRKALKERNLPVEKFTRADLKLIAPQLQSGLRLFLGKNEAERAVQELTELGGISSVRALSFKIAGEADISNARSAARRICDDMGARSLVTQKVTTIVSELARNIVSYTSGGTVEIDPVTTGSRRMIIVRAADQGSGIPHLSLVMSGNYKSKTGLGRGLFGTKRLADEFNISTGVNGTTIIAEVRI
jgi:serine/threonine-protein kinase RsbT